MMQIEPVILTGRLVRLEPLQMKHASDLYEMGRIASEWPEVKERLEAKMRR